MTEPSAQTTSGTIRGAFDGDVAVFKGVPYGASTAGEARFQAPQSHAPWDGVLDCLDYGPSSPQPPRRGPSISGPPPSESEDCLVLNVWTRGLNDGGKRPIMFWIHGGGFSTGSGSSPLYDGTNLCRRGDVVSISVNHRLGIPGHLYLKEIGGAKYATSGVNSFLDLILALEWVRDNATAFGGDPDNVMIFGESGGGGKVLSLMTMPKARGLFKRVAIQSGVKANGERKVDTVFGKHGITPEEANHFTREVLAKLGIGEDEVDKLLELPIEDIEAAQGEVEASGIVMGPVIDGDLFPRHPYDPDPAPTAVDVPMLIGANGDEWYNYISTRPEFPGIDFEGVIKWTAAWSLGREQAERVVAEYRALDPDARPEDLLTTICSDHLIRVPSVRLADMQAAAGKAPVYFYMFTFDSPTNGKSFHALEIPFVFDNVDRTPLTGEGPERFPIASAMSDAWIAFARTGNPNHEGLPEWPLYDPDQRPTMIFDLNTRVENDPFGPETRIWDGIL